MIRFEELNDKGHYEENEEIFAVRSISNTVSTKVIPFLHIPAGGCPPPFCVFDNRKKQVRPL